ncbi:UNVERIFIED_CONTAM: hypothetical protein HDU68_008523, partial [Siphonaria sp. JEL0065]
TLDYLISQNIQFQKYFLWAVEQRELSRAIPYSGNNSKVSESTGCIMILYFTAKILINIFCHAVEQGIVNKRSDLFEDNMATVLVYLFKSIQIACGHSGDVREFKKALPDGFNYKGCHVSPSLEDALQGFGFRFRGWSLKLYTNLDKGVV